MNSWHITMAEGWHPGECRLCRSMITAVCKEAHKPVRVCPLACATKNLFPFNEGKVAGDTQKERLANVLKDYKPHSTFELVRKVYGINVATVARLASRVDDLRREGWTIKAMKSKKQLNKWWYCAMSTPAGVSSLDMSNIVDADMAAADAAAGEYE